MENVQNKLFYHIQTVKPDRQFWLQGETYEVGKNKNSFYSFYDSFDPRGKPQEYVLREYDTFIREEIFEYVRRESFKDLPSRHNCFWLIPYNENSDEALAYWTPKIASGNPFQILILNCSGKAHYTSNLFMPNMYQSFANIRQTAKNYWLGLNVDVNSKETEVLFEGLVTVVTFINPFHPQKSLDEACRFRHSQQENL